MLALFSVAESDTKLAKYDIKLTESDTKLAEYDTMLAEHDTKLVSVGRLSHLLADYSRISQKIADLSLSLFSLPTVTICFVR